MNTVGRIGSYITRGVYTFSGPFHPFGGAVDIIVVEQQDGSFKSSPWYVRFGKFQGVLKAKEKVVTICVNGVEADFHMYLDHTGEAHFLREMDVEEGESVLSPPSSGEDTDGQTSERRPGKSKSCNYDADKSDPVTEVDLSNGKVLMRKGSRRAKIMELFGRMSMKENQLQDGDVVRADLLERAEIAADLLEVKWSTNLGSSKHRKDDASQFSTSVISNTGESDNNLQINDGPKEVESLVSGDVENTLDHSVSHRRTDSNGHEMDEVSQIGCRKLENSVEETREVSCSLTDHVVGTSSSSESGFGENSELNCEAPRKIHGFCESNADLNKNAKVDNETTLADLPILESVKLEAEHGITKEFASQYSVASEEGSTENECESIVYYEASESSGVGADGYGGQIEEALSQEVCVCVENLQVTAEVTCTVNSIPERGLLPEQLSSNVEELLRDGLESERSSASLAPNNVVTETYSEMVSAHSINGSLGEAMPRISVMSSSSDSYSPVQYEEYTKDGDTLSNHQHSPDSAGCFQESIGDLGAMEEMNISASAGLEEELLLFGDLDDVESSKVRCMKFISSDQQERDNHSSVISKGTEALVESSNSNFDSYSSPDKFFQDNSPNDEDAQQISGLLSNPIDIPFMEVASEESRRMTESLPNMWSNGHGMDADGELSSTGHSLDSNPKSSKWTLLRQDVSRVVKLDAEKEHLNLNANDGRTLEELNNLPADAVVGDTSKVMGASGGSWIRWPFSLKRTTSMKATQMDLPRTRSFDAEITLESTPGIDEEKNGFKPKINQEKQRNITPTSEQLASLNLKEGGNIVTFTYSTAMLGKQQVDARIYLWKWNSRIVISDVDGTITRSDVLGQFMPLVGVDWSQTGVAHLFSAIKENGYQLLFLSARAISQAYITRQFLLNLKQDGKALPDGPVVISPDGLFPSLFREVIRRAPHEFKIACLEDIKALFPSDSNPFYAGFGNRDTDEFSYLKVGIPIGKIFIINPKGEVAVNRRVDTKSYTSLHSLVHGMFPPTSSTEQEDFNAWNFWKLPPPPIDL